MDTWLCEVLFLNKINFICDFFFQSDIVYTFFHPLLRDEQEAQKAKLNVTKLKGTSIKT